MDLRGDLTADLDRATIILGHTRFRTQGSTTALRHTSPLIVDNVIGTHNGDIDVTTLPLRPLSVCANFDTELLLGAMSAADGDRHAIRDVLEGMVGRAALVWVDLRNPDLIYFARAALSPLAMACDQFGRLFWASNPAWLRTCLPKAGLQIVAPRLLREGTIEAYRLRHGTPELAWREEFVPITRNIDVRLRQSVALLGYEARDRAIDDALLRHRLSSVDLSLPNPAA